MGSIQAVLTARIDRYRTRYEGKLPKELPVTLDEWAWLSEDIYGFGSGVDATAYQGIPLTLVEGVFETKDGGLVVRR